MARVSAESALDFSDVDFGAVARVASEVSITNVELVSLSAEAPGLSELTEFWAQESVVGLHSVFESLSSGLFTALVTFRVATSKGFETNGNGGSEALNATLVEVQATFRLTYSLIPEHIPAMDDLNHFCRFNGIFNAWPYGREVFQSVTARMGLKPFILPTFKVPALATGIREKDQTTP